MAEKDATARLRRAVKENNLFIVKRLIQRTDMRNPDPAPRRYTSLAWAAVLGHEETFEFLMTAGHDDAELSKARPRLSTAQFLCLPQFHHRTRKITPFSCYSPTILPVP
jgi:ankyrin repeat protein